MRSNKLNEVVAYLSQEPATYGEIKERVGFFAPLDYIKKGSIARKGHRNGYVYYVPNTPAEGKVDEKLIKVNPFRQLDFEGILLGKLKEGFQRRDELIKSLTSEHCPYKTKNRYANAFKDGLERLLGDEKAYQAPADYLFAKHSPSYYIVYLPGQEEEVAEELLKGVGRSYLHYKIRKSLPPKLESVVYKKMVKMRRKGGGKERQKGRSKTKRALKQ